MPAGNDGFVVRKATLNDLVIKSRANEEPVSLRQKQRLGAARLGATRPGISHMPRFRRRIKIKGFSLADRLVATAGIALAALSASFATFMLSTDHSHPVFNGAEHLMIFANPNLGTRNPIMGRVPGAPAAERNQGIDFTATGAIPGKSEAPTPPRYTLPSLNAPKETILSEFTLRGVSGNVAMIDDHDHMYRLEVGSELPGGGRVLSIDWMGGRFVVVTTRGLIREANPD